jgi:hypothetical protein
MTLKGLLPNFLGFSPFFISPPKGGLYAHLSEESVFYGNNLKSAQCGCASWRRSMSRNASRERRSFIGSLLDGFSKQRRHHTDRATQPFFNFLLSSRDEEGLPVFAKRTYGV